MRDLLYLCIWRVCILETSNSFRIGPNLHQRKGKSCYITFQKDFSRFAEAKGILYSHGDVVFHSDRGQRSKIKVTCLEM